MDLSDAVLRRFRLELLDRIRTSAARGVILDVSGIEVMDYRDFEALHRTMTMARLMGAPSVLAGLQAGVVSSLVELGVETEDVIAADVRSSLRNIQSAFETYQIQLQQLDLNRDRVVATEELYNAGRNEARDLLDAKRGLLNARLALTEATVQYANARLQLMNDLEAIALEPKGLRFDPALKIPQLNTAEPPE